MTADDTTATTTQDSAPQAPGRPQRRRKAQAPRKALLLAGETVNAGTLAAMIGDKPGAHEWALGRKVNDKRVRSLARDVIERLSAENRTGYTAHAYTQAEADAIVAAMATAGRGAPTANANALRARATGKVSA
jgi:hypothetical protein